MFKGGESEVLQWIVGKKIARFFIKSEERRLKSHQLLPRKKSQNCQEREKLQQHYKIRQ